jgi:hypothetical protein
MLSRIALWNGGNGWIMHELKQWKEFCELNARIPVLVGIFLS